MRKIHEKVIVSIVRQKRNDISVSLKLFFLLLQCVTALDFGFVPRKTACAKVLVRIFTIAQCSVVFVITIKDFNMPENGKEIFVLGVWIVIMLMQYIYHCMVLVFNSNRSFYHLLVTLNSVDKTLGVGSNSYNTEYLIIGSCSASISIRIINMLIYCVYFEDECFDSLFTQIMIKIQIIVTDLALLVSFLYFYVVYSRLKMLNNIVQECDQRTFIHLIIYKTLVDSVYRIKKTFNWTFAGALVFKTPELLATAYLGLLNIKQNDKFADEHFVRVLFASHVVFLLFAPAGSAGLLTAEATKLKVILHEKLLQETNPDQARVLEHFSEYVSARPLQLSVLKVVPLDWTLPLLILDLCISYQIAIVQFTHLY